MALDWQSSGSKVAVNGIGLVIDCLRGCQVAVKWQPSGSEVEVKWQSSGIGLVTDLLRGCQVALDW